MQIRSAQLTEVRPRPHAMHVDRFTDTADEWPSLYCDRINYRSLNMTLQRPDLQHLLYEPITAQTIGRVNAVIQNEVEQYAREHGHVLINPSDRERLSHVAHSHRRDDFTVDPPLQFERGSNAWVSAYSVNTDDFGRLSVDVELTVANVLMTSGDMHLNYEDLPVADKEKSKREEMRWRLKRNLVIHIKTRADYSFLRGWSESERKAIETLREMISESDFRKYLKYGFILVPANSGSVYQIFRDKAHTKVWENGQCVEEVCVRINDPKIPLTDNVIAFKTMIETNEDLFKKMGNVYNMRRLVA